MNAGTTGAHQLGIGQGTGRLNDRIKHYKKLLVRNWWLIALCVSMGVCAQAWKVSTYPDEYRSNARIVVTGQLAFKDSVDYREEMANFYGTAVQILQSTELKRRVRERVKSIHPEMNATTVGLTIERQKNSAILNVLAQGGSPAYVQAFLDALLDEYVAFRREMRSKVSESAIDRIELQLALEEKRLGESRAKLQSFEEENNVVVLEEGRNNSAQYLRGLKAQLADLKAEGNLLRRLDIEKNILRRNDPGEPFAGGEEPPSVPLADAERDYLKTRREIELLKEDITEKLRNWKPAHPKIKELERKLRQAERLLAVYRRESEAKNAQRIESVDLPHR